MNGDDHPPPGRDRAEEEAEMIPGTNRELGECCARH